MFANDRPRKKLGYDNHHCHNRNYLKTKLHLMQGTTGEEGAEVEGENLIKEIF